MAERTIGTIATNRDGIAVLAYTGKGNGHINFLARYDTAEERAEVLDCIKYDMATTDDHNDDMWNSTSNIIRYDHHTEFQQSTTDIYTIYTPINDDICIEIDIYGTFNTNTPIISIRQTSTVLANITRSNANLPNNQWTHITIQIINKQATITADTMTTPIITNVTGMNRLTLRQANGEQLSFKNVKIYSI